MKQSEYIYTNFCNELNKVDVLKGSHAHYLANEGFVQELFSVCKKVSYIGINALKFREPNSTKVQASFQYVDIDSAISHLISFHSTFPDAKITELLEIVGQIHKYAYSEDDVSKMYGTVWDNSSSMRIGSYHNFADLPKDIWMKICQYTEECIDNGVEPDSARTDIFKD